MITIKDWMTAVNYKITEGSEYGWQCFGPNAYCLDSWDGQFNGVSTTIIFDTVTQTVYSVEIHDYTNNRAYRMINPEFANAQIKESNERNTPVNEAWDNVAYIDLDVDEDILEKLTAIMAGQEYDTRVQIPLNLTQEELHTLMLMAHQADLSLNQFVVKLLTDFIDKLESKKDPS